MIPIFEPNLTKLEKKYLSQAIDEGWISSQGRFINEFEKKIAERFDRKYGIATSNCTAALHLSLVALGIGQGDEVICPNLTFIAPANMISLTGAKPVLVDIEEESWNLDPDLVKEAITDRTKAIIIVHSFGHSAKMDELLDIAKKNKISIIEDNAESPGGLYKGKKLGNFGDLSCFSFFANKIITTGEGGIILTNDKKKYIILKELRDHGMANYKKYLHIRLGFNYRMTNMQAAIGLAQLSRFDEILQKRLKQENIYKSFLESSKLSFRPIQPWASSVHWLMTIKLKKEGIRDSLINYLLKYNIDSRQMIYPVSFATHFKKENKSKKFPLSENISLNSLHLPSSTQLKINEIRYISNKVLEGLQKYS